MAAFREKFFPSLAGVLWIWFLFLDLTGRAGSSPVKFAGICLCFLVSLTALNTRDGALVAAALGLTVCADIFLLLLDRSLADRLTGVSIFLAVQLLYAVRLCSLRGFSRWSFPARLSGLGLGLLVCLFFQDPLAGLSLAYFSNLCINAARAFAPPDGKFLSRFRRGLLLFIGCDLCVGAWNLGLFGKFAGIGMWFFYLPSQTLIVLSQDVKGNLL